MTYFELHQHRSHSMIVNSCFRNRELFYSIQFIFDFQVILNFYTFHSSPWGSSSFKQLLLLTSFHFLLFRDSVIYIYSKTAYQKCMVSSLCKLMNFISIYSLLLHYAFAFIHISILFAFAFAIILKTFIHSSAFVHICIH